MRLDQDRVRWRRTIGFYSQAVLAIELCCSQSVVEENHEADAHLNLTFVFVHIIFLFTVSREARSTLERPLALKRTTFLPLEAGPASCEECS